MPVKCEPCNRDFESAEALSQHNRDKHGIGKESKQEKRELEQQAKKEQKESELEKSIKAKKIKRVAKYSVALLIFIVLLYFTIISIGSSPTARIREGLGAAGSQHVHADFKVYLDGRAVDFSLPRYQVRAQHVHVEGGDGDVIHVHATGVKVGYFFSTLNMKFSESCFVIDSRNYCSNGNKTLKFYVNGEPNSEWENYVLQSTDRILISYGNESDISAQLDSVTAKGTRFDTGQDAAPTHRF